MRRAVLAALALMCMLVGPRPAAAQDPTTGPATVRPEPAGRRDIPPVSPVFLASAVLPGAAQYMMGDDRWVPYAATEVWALVSYLQQRQSARRVERRYRDLAWQVARRVSVGERRDTVFEYYEAMAYFTSSGEWLPGGQPELQEGTFNGEIWKLARALYFPGGAPAPPESTAYQQALAYYLQRAIPPGYAWAWGASNLEQQVFADLIAESDAAFRSATRYLGIIVANHIASSVDALITTRLRQLSGTRVDMESTPFHDGAGPRLEVGLRVRF